MNAHAQDIMARMNGPVEFRDGRCSYCGSMSFERAIALLKTRGTAYAGCPWEYEYPQKFRIGDGIFHSEHLRDCTAEQLVLWNAVAQPLLGIGFVRESEAFEDFFFSAPSPYYTSIGIVP